jgi:hypothetical protein
MSCATQIIHEETNSRIYNRNLPSQMLQPYLDARPVSTKYSLLPVLDPRTRPTVPLKPITTFNVNQIFNPGNTTSPWSGFSSNINVESDLRNQFYALQKCSQAVYVPQSISDLYVNPVIKSSAVPEPFPGLIQRESFPINPRSEPLQHIDHNMFLNSSRVMYNDICNNNKPALRKGSNIKSQDSQKIKR